MIFAREISQGCQRRCFGAFVCLFENAFEKGNCPRAEKYQYPVGGWAEDCVSRAIGTQ